MVSKNTIALFLTINLVLFGFTVAQSPTCPRDTKACSEGYAVAMGPDLIILGLELLPCCTLLGCADASVTSVCICNALKAVNVTTPINEGVGYVVSVCGAASFVPDIKCA